MTGLIDCFLYLNEMVVSSRDIKRSPRLCEVLKHFAAVSPLAGIW